MSKQEILDYFSEINYVYNNPNMLNTLSNMIDKLLEEHSPKKGRWIRFKENCLYYKCSVCESPYCTEGDFCPNCGADMRKENENG